MALIPALAPFVAAAAEPTTQQLQAEIRALRARLESLERHLSSGKTTLLEEKNSARVLVDEKGFRITSADEAHELRVGGYIQAQGRAFADDASDADTFLLRRARLVVEGKVFEDFRFRLMPDFAGDEVTLQDGYVEWAPDAAFTLRAGKFKSPVGLERLQSATALWFPERGLPTNLVPNRDVGVMIYGDPWDGRVHYDLALLNGVPDGGSFKNTDENQGKDVAARLFLSPFKSSKITALKGLSLGVAGTIGTHEGPAASYRTPGQQTYFRYGSGVATDGEHYRIAPQLFWGIGPVGLLAEYVVSQQSLSLAGQREDLTNHAWQVAAQWVITGEDAKLGNVKPKRSVHDGGPGAWFLAARYGELDIDDDAFALGFASPLTSASETRSAGVALNWLPNPNVKATLSYDHTTFDGGRVSGDRAAEEVFIGQLQLAF